MWIPMWIVCVGVTCQQLELVEFKSFQTKEECEVFARETAQELLPQADRVGYKCAPEKDA